MKVTRPFVEKQLENLNRLTGMPFSPYIDRHDGNGIVPQAGNYHIDSAYGGWEFVRMSLTQGSSGTTKVGSNGHVSLKQISNDIAMFSEGYRAAKEARNIP